MTRAVIGFRKLSESKQTYTYYVYIMIYHSVSPSRCRRGLWHRAHAPLRLPGRRRENEPRLQTALHNALHNAQCTTHNAQRTMHDARRTPHNAQCTMHNAQCTMHNEQCTPHTARCTMHNAQCTMHNVPHCKRERALHLNSRPADWPYRVA